MKKTVLNLFVSAVTLFLCFPAQAADPVEENCTLAKVMSEGTDAILDQFEKMAALWNDSDRDKMDPVFRPELAQFKLESGVVYEVANLDPFMREHLVVTADSSRATAVYFRVLHVKGPQGYMFRNVRFNSDYKEIFAIPLVQEPRRISCG